MEQSIHALIDQIGRASATFDEAARKSLYNALQRLSWSLESPYDSMQRLMFSGMQVPLLRTGIDMGLFTTLSQSKEPLTSEAIATKTKADVEFVERVCRYLAAFGVLQETASNTWQANEVTRTLTVPGWASGVKHHHEMLGPVYQCTPLWFEERKYQLPSDPTRAPINVAWSTTLPCYEWWATQPKLVEYFLQWMAIQRTSQPTCLDVYDIKAKARGLAHDQVFFVDIGGNAGHQAIAVRKLLPDLPNRIINEDLQFQLDIAIQHPGVENLFQDFWTPQAITGARVYYMRNIIHNWPDDKAIDILRNTRDALGKDPESAILIDDMVIPDVDAPWQAMQLDMIMMVALAARERTLEQWKQLIAAAGLKIKQIYTYTHSLRDSVIECVAA